MRYAVRRNADGLYAANTGWSPDLAKAQLFNTQAGAMHSFYGMCWVMKKDPDYDPKKHKNKRSFGYLDKDKFFARFTLVPVEISAVAVKG